MKRLIIFLIVFFPCHLSCAAVSTTTNNIDQNFIGASALYPVDLDRDGDMDVIGVATGGNEVAWWQNNGSQVFTKWSIDAAFNGANAVFAVDIDSDGDMDILAAGGTNVSWWENTGTPAQNAWANRWNIDAAFNGANSVYALDFDLDGDIDVLATGGNNVSWWENTGTPRQNNWANQRDISTVFNGANSVFAADMDKDGDIDVLATAGTGAGTLNDVSWWENNGNPLAANNWLNKWDIDANFTGANAIFVIDMDRDGDLDVLSTSGTGVAPLNDVSWWENDGTPNNNAWTEYVIDNNFIGAISLYAKDLDFDGDLDVIGAANTDDDVVWWQNDGNPKQNTWTENPINQNFNGASFVYAVDLDKDGDMDVLAAADTDNTVAWWANDANRVSGNIGFSSLAKIEDYFNGSRFVVSTDLDLDGDPDIIAAAKIADDVIWWENDGSPDNGGWIQHVITNDFDGAYCAAVADIDTDGDMDIAVVAFNDNELAWWENDGSQNFTVKHTLDNAFEGASSLFIIDLDIDGDLDIVAAAGRGDDVAWWRNDGAQNFTKIFIDENNFNGASDVYCLDLDSDGDIDVLGTADVDDNVVWWRNDGAAQNFTKLTIDGNFNGASGVIGGDLDLDGDIDVIASAYNGNNISWWANDGSPGDGGWTEYVIDNTLTGASDLNVLDLDLDGDIDVVGSAVLSDDVIWVENDGSPADGGWVRHAIDTNFDGASSVSCIDLDRDGDIDILGAAENADDVGWWENGGAEAADTGTGSTEAATPFISVDFTSLNVPTSTKGSTGLTEVGIAERGTNTEEAERKVDVKCFIATASFGTPLASEVQTLCRYRDEYLMKTACGRWLVKTYYRVSPPLARLVSGNDFLKSVVCKFLRIILKVLSV